MTEAEIETFKRALAEIKWVSDEEVAWTKLRKQIGLDVAERVELSTVLMVEALAEAGWNDRQIRDFLAAQRFREPENLSGEAREAAEGLVEIAAEVGDEVIRTVIACDVSDDGWPLVLEQCEVRPRTERIKLR